MSSAGAFQDGDHSDRADVRFARPNIQIYDAYVVDLYQWVCARYFVGVEAQKQRQSAVKLGSRPNFRTDHVGFQNPSRPDAIRESTIEKQRFTLYFKMILRRGSQSIPIEKQRIFHLLRPKPTIRATAEMGFGLQQKTCSANGLSSTTGYQRLAKGKSPPHLNFPFSFR